jgi:hypothetical protein
LLHNIIKSSVLAHQLLVVTWLYVTTMVLVEVIKLIVNIHWGNHISSNSKVSYITSIDSWVTVRR